VPHTQKRMTAQGRYRAWRRRGLASLVFSP